MENKVYNIAKLTGENYFLWRIKIEMVLQREKLWSVINEDPPATNADEWNNRDSSSRALIGLSLEDKILINVSACMTAKEMWNQLEKTYRHTNLTSKLNLLKRLYGCRYQDFNNMESYLNQIKELTVRLRVCGENIKDSHIMAVMLCGLPPQYDAIITALESKPESELSLQYVSEKLRDEATRKEKHFNQEEEHDMAMATRSMTINRGPRSRVRCFKCGKEGHIQNYCNNRDKYKEKQATNSTDFSNYRGEGRSRNKPDHSNFMTYEQRQSESEDESVDLAEEWAFTGTDTKSCTDEKLWILDSGATSHMTHNRVEIQDFTLYKKPVVVHLANGDEMEALGSGKIKFFSDICGQSGADIVLSEVLWVPKLIHKLISIRKLCKEGYNISFSREECVIQRNDETIAIGLTRNNVFVVQIHITNRNSQVENASVCIHTWHRRMAHRSLKGISDTQKREMVRDLKITTCDHQDFCEVCPLGGMTQKPFRSVEKRTSLPFKGLVADLCGPIKPSTLGGKRYFLMITDCATNFTSIELLENKYETTSRFCSFLKSGNNQFGYYPNFIRTDGGGGEFVNTELDQYLEEHGVQHQTTVPETPQQNGKAERLNRTILTMMKMMMKDSGLPLELWGEAAVTAVYIYNRSRHSDSNKTPYEGWWGKRPSVNHLRIFGSDAYAYVPRRKRTKLENNAIKGKLVGYGQSKKCYRIWIEGTNKILNSISATFNETAKFGGVHQKGKEAMKLRSVSQREEEEDVIIPSQYLDTEEDRETNEPRRSMRKNKGIPANRLTLSAVIK